VVVDGPLGIVVPGVLVGFVVVGGVVVGVVVFVVGVELVEFELELLELGDSPDAAPSLAGGVDETAAAALLPALFIRLSIVS
jgi:hypothetical protein